LENDTYAIGFKEILQKFDIKPASFKLVDQNSEVLRQVDLGLADAGVISRSVGLKIEADYKVHRSSIVCCAREARFAAPRERVQGFSLLWIETLKS